MLTAELLLEILEDLLEGDFKKFKWYLTLGVTDSYEPMTRASMEKANREDVVDKMIRSYGGASAVELTADILQRMCMMGTAQRLMSAYAAGRETSASSSSSSSATAPPAAPASVTAQHGSVVVAPTIIGSTAGSLNITINKT